MRPNGYEHDIKNENGKFFQHTMYPETPNKYKTDKMRKDFRTTKLSS